MAHYHHLVVTQPNCRANGHRALVVEKPYLSQKSSPSYLHLQRCLKVYKYLDKELSILLLTWAFLMMWTRLLWVTQNCSNPADRARTFISSGICNSPGSAPSREHSMAVRLVMKQKKLSHFLPGWHRRDLTARTRRAVIFTEALISADSAA